MNKHQLKTGESLWLIEQTDQTGIRKFWAGDIWTDNALSAVRFPSKRAAAVLACHYAWSSFGHPPCKNELVDICEHLFQCGTTDLEQQRDAALKLAEKWEVQAIKYPLENATSLVSPYTAEAVAVGQAAVRACANELRAIFEPKEGK